MMRYKLTKDIFPKHKQLVLLLLWIAFVGCAFWEHAQQSQQPPIYDAFSYYIKSFNFWTQVHQLKLFNPFNVEPSFRPPGTILMAYPFGFDIDYRGFYFRSTFLPFALLNISVIIGGYHSSLNSKRKWLLVLLAAFLSTMPCLYAFEPAQEIPAVMHWGLVDNFLAGVASLATAAAVRSSWTRSSIWTCLAAVFSSFCLLIKPAGLMIMMLVSLLWFGWSFLQLKSVWQSPDEWKNMTRWILKGLVLFSIPYLIVFATSFTSQYLSTENLAYGNAAIRVMQSELLPSWTVLSDTVHLGLGYAFTAWLFLMVLFFSQYLLQRSPGCWSWLNPSLTGPTLASGITLIFGIWFWIFGSGGSTQIRYFIPFVFMTAIFMVPIFLKIVPLRGWQLSVLLLLMTMPIINIGILLPQRYPSIQWQKITGINLSSGSSDTVMVQAQNFVSEVKRKGGHNIILYSISMNKADAIFSSAIQYGGVTMSPLPIRSMIRPIDWQRPSTYRKKEMLDSDYWLFQPMTDSQRAQMMLATTSIDNFEQEKALFEAWATQLTSNDGVSVVSDTPTARVIQINDLNLLEPAFDNFIAKHRWRDVFIAENPKRLFNEKDLTAVLASNQPGLEDINFSGRFYLRALSVSRSGDNTVVRFWWRPQTPISENDWSLFVHLIDADGKIVTAHGVPIRFNRDLSSLKMEFLFDQFTFFNPVGAEKRRLAIGFVRPEKAPLTADKGTRDWNNKRVIVPIP